jgi:hypothetical protein
MNSKFEREVYGVPCKGSRCVRASNREGRFLEPSRVFHLNLNGGRGICAAQLPKENIHSNIDTHGLECADGLRGAGTSQRTRGPYLLARVSTFTPLGFTPLYAVRTAQTHGPGLEHE